MEFACSKLSFYTESKQQALTKLYQKSGFLHKDHLVLCLSKSKSGPHLVYSLELYPRWICHRTRNWLLLHLLVIAVGILWASSVPCLIDYFEYTETLGTRLTLRAPLVDIQV